MKRNINKKSKVVKKFIVETPKKSTEQNCDINNDATCCIIFPNPEIVKNKVSNSSSVMIRKTLRQNNEKYLVDAMEKWFEQARDRGEIITGRMIQDKALFFHGKINGTSSFKASSSWLYNFKKRCGIQYLQKKEYNSSEGTKYFSNILKEKISSENLSLENIYNADETGINWKVPDFCTSSIETSEIKFSGHDDDVSNRVTALFASNSTGNHKIPLLIIGEAKMSNCLKDLITKKTKHNRLNFLTSINVTYAGQKNARMSKEIFKLWYEFVFIPSALNHRTASGTSGKILLIIDNAPCHSDIDELNAVHSQCEVINLPHNVPSVIQPMEQDLMTTVVKIYKRNLLLLMFKAKLKNVDQFWNTFTLKECFTFLASSWETLNSSILRKAWVLFLDNYCDTSDVITVKPNTTVFFNNLIDELSSFPDDICDKLIARLSPGADCSIRKLQKDKVIIVKWFKIRDDFGWDPLTDEKIINLTLDNKRKDELLDDPLRIDGEFQENIPLTPTENYESEMTFNETWKNELEDVKDDDEDQVTSTEALNSLRRVKKWILSCEKSSKKHQRFVDELEKLITQYC
ncbi:jerky protein homolog-like [Leptopilina heterotoma]|uniref:jerky protein homolog-like n=1 Tax=Leptopilina heterotoma TaxID=63436 RepID=UPI001CA8F42A|nr:jerky protein homolog-like [Leptopilina heterotoma]